MIELQKNLKYLVCGGVSILALAGATPVQATSFVSTFRPPGTSTEVGTINPATGVYTTYSTITTSPLQLTDIAATSADQVYGTTYDQLYKINAGNNTSTFVGNLGVTGMNGLAFDNNNNLFGIAGCNRNAGSAQSCPGSDGSPGFYKISTTSGIASLISNLGSLAPTAFGFAGTTSTGDTSDLVFSPTTGKFLAVSGNANPTLFSIDPSTGATSTLGSVTSGGNPVGFISGLTFDGGILRGYTTNKQQIVINPTNGIVSSILPISGINTLPDGSNFLVGGAASTAAATAVPEPSFLPGFVFLGTCLGARFAMKRKKQPIDE
jgi:hypothetical protein